MMQHRPVGLPKKVSIRFSQDVRFGVNANANATRFGTPAEWLPRCKRKVVPRA